MPKKPYAVIGNLRAFKMGRLRLATHSLGSSRLPSHVPVPVPRRQFPSRYRFRRRKPTKANR